MATAFATLLAGLINDKGYKSLRAFITKAEGAKREDAGVGYLSKVLKSAKPHPAPLARIEAWAEALDLKPGTPEHSRFTALAAITHLPEEVQSRFVQLFDDYAELAEWAAKHRRKVGSPRQDYRPE